MLTLLMKSVSEHMTQSRMHSGKFCFKLHKAHAKNQSFDFSCQFHGVALLQGPELFINHDQ